MKKDFLGQIGEIIVFAAMIGLTKNMDNWFGIKISAGVDILIAICGVVIFIFLKNFLKKRKKASEIEILEKIKRDERFKD